MNCYTLSCRRSLWSSCVSNGVVTTREKRCRLPFFRWADGGQSLPAGSYNRRARRLARCGRPVGNICSRPAVRPPRMLLACQLADQAGQGKWMGRKKPFCDFHRLVPTDSVKCGWSATSERDCGCARLAAAQGSNWMLRLHPAADQLYHPGLPMTWPETTKDFGADKKRSITAGGRAAIASCVLRPTANHAGIATCKSGRQAWRPVDTRQRWHSVIRFGTTLIRG